MRSCGVGGVHPLASVRASHFALSQSVHGDKLSRAIGYGVCTYKSSLYRRNITTADPIPLLRPEDFLFWALSVSLFSPPPSPLLFSLLPFFTILLSRQAFSSFSQGRLQYVSQQQPSLRIPTLDKDVKTPNYVENGCRTLKPFEKHLTERENQAIPVNEQFSPTPKQSGQLASVALVMWPPKTRR